MYFEIENTPERIRRTRNTQDVKEASPKEPLPRLVLGPFAKPPKVVFENVFIGTTCERILELHNPCKQKQQITLARAPPSGLKVHLPEEWLTLEPESSYYVSLSWSPTQPTAARETIRFTNLNRGRYDVFLILQSAMIVQKTKPKKGFKTSPGKKIKNVSKRSPGKIYTKKYNVVHNTTTKVTETPNVVDSTQINNVLRPSNKDNVMYDDQSINSEDVRCPFDSLTSQDFHFDTSEIFSNIRNTRTDNNLYNTYDKAYLPDHELPELSPQNIWKATDNEIENIFDNLTFTPLKTLKDKPDKSVKTSKIIESIDLEQFDDSLDTKTSNKENETHSIISVAPSQQNEYFTVKYQNNAQFEVPIIQSKKIPNTSSPKEQTSPNFSLHTDFSRISELSFVPPRFSTERKMVPKLSYEPNEVFDGLNIKLNSDTYTKDSPIIETHQLPFENTNPKNQPKLPRTALFKCNQQRDIYDRLVSYDNSIWPNDYKTTIKSPPRSMTPPLQSIPEESSQYHTKILDKTNQEMATYTINRTFDKIPERTSISSNRRDTWSKRDVRAEPQLWKVPTSFPKKSSKPKASISSKESFSNTINIVSEGNKITNQNTTLNLIGNVYSQSTTVNPFLPDTYNYDDEALHKFMKEFTRWLNYILTPPADLDSNEDQKVNVGNAWLENRNKEVPAAPTKEQVSSAYHNSNRLEGLRRAARTLLKSAEIDQIFEKLNSQIDRKLIAIRTDRNLHLDVGLQKTILELILCYNPLWLRIGLETIYYTILPLKSNSDIEGLTTFIIQRLFKNPNLKNKNSKSSAPNMLTPAYMEALKKYTLKKFFKLVFFLDHAKQRKLIAHDPCLFRRIASCKESREIIIHFTKELIAGIGDITKHLRPLGYVVSHKQSFLDEYKYAVHNVAVDIRDGVRLTKVMEIILMKNGLLKQLRTPPISRLQKIHNVQVALNALKEANFVIHGDISAQDIADGHREKTLSLLWQIIHIFRAPLFEKAANVIQAWWRKKYEVIVEKRKEENKRMQKYHKAASIIQYWWRRTQYNRLVEWQMNQIVKATIILQKYCRMWIQRTQFLKCKRSVIKIEKWYQSVRLTREAKEQLETLKLQREELKRKSATVVQSWVRRWLCMKNYTATRQKIVYIQSIIRCVLARRRYLKLRQCVIFVQRRYKAKVLMRAETHKFTEKRKSAILLQSYFRMVKQRRSFVELKKSVKVIEERYLDLLKMREQQKKYALIKTSIITLQARFRRRQCQKEFMRQKQLIIKLQQRVRAYLQMKRDRSNFLILREATKTLQKWTRSYFLMKKLRELFIRIRSSAVVIQTRFRAYRTAKAQREKYLQMRSAAIVIQTRYRSLKAMRHERSTFLKLKNAALILQRRYRALKMMKFYRENYTQIKYAAIVIQGRFIAQMKMKCEKARYNKMKAACLTIQTKYRAHLLGKHERQHFINMRQAAVKIQKWFKGCLIRKKVLQQYQQTKQACLTIQRVYKAYIIGRKQRQEYLKIKTATLCIQKYYRSYIEMKSVREEFVQLKAATVTIQRHFRSLIETRKQQEQYQKILSAAKIIQQHYRLKKLTKDTRKQFLNLKRNVIIIQMRYRSLCAMKNERNKYLKLRASTITIQQRFRAILAMRRARQYYTKLRAAAIVIQTKYRAQRAMKLERLKYITIVEASVKIQRFFRAFLVGKLQRQEFLAIKKCTVALQQRYRALLSMRRQRELFLSTRKAVLVLQRRYRARKLMINQRAQYQKKLNAIITLQRAFRAYKEGQTQRSKYIKIRDAIVFIQTWFRSIEETRKIRTEYQQLRKAVLFTQRRFRANMLSRAIQREIAANKIKCWYKTVQKGKQCRQQFLELKRSATLIQATFRMYVERKRFISCEKAVLTIQNHYRAYKLSKADRKMYTNIRTAIIKLQSYVRRHIARKRFLAIRSAVVTMQAAYRMKIKMQHIKEIKEKAAICIQKNFRRYLAQKRYIKYREKVLYIQKKWKGKLVMRLIRCEFLQKRNMIIKLQSAMRGYLVRRYAENKRKEIQRFKIHQKREKSATLIQAYYRGYRVRCATANDKRVTELRRRWREGALKSTQESLGERKEYALDALRNFPDIQTVIKAFQSLDLMTEVLPKEFINSAPSVVRRVYIYMSSANRSISSIEVLKSASAVLVNLARFPYTGPKIYSRKQIDPILKFMLRFCNSQPHLFCIMCTYLWLFSKYDKVRQDLKEFLHEPENRKLLETIKANVERGKRMEINSTNYLKTPKALKTRPQMNRSLCSNLGVGSKCDRLPLPVLKPDYGVRRPAEPRYFLDAYQAITCLLNTYDL